MAWRLPSWLWAACRFDFAGFHLRLRGQILALRVVHFLLRHQARLRLRDAVQPVELQVQNLVLRFHAVQFVLRRA